jgi:hypothetical protein
MDTGSWIWMILFYVFTGVFFAVAGFVIIFGFRDLIHLLSKAEKQQ